jgi:hypothetical protein
MRDCRKYCHTSKARLHSRLPTAAHPANNLLDLQMGASRTGRADLTGRVVEEEATLADNISSPIKIPHNVQEIQKLREVNDPFHACWPRSKLRVRVFSTGDRHFQPVEWKYQPFPHETACSDSRGFSAGQSSQCIWPGPFFLAMYMAASAVQTSPQGSRTVAMCSFFWVLAPMLTVREIS